jgi:hypothetical protein
VIGTAGCSEIRCSDIVPERERGVQVDGLDLPVGVEQRGCVRSVNGLRGNILHVARSLKKDSQLGLAARDLGSTCGRRSSGMLGQRLAIRLGGELQLGLGFAVVG